MRNEELSAEIDRLLQVFPGTVGIVIKDVHDGRSLQYNAQEVFPAASLIKLPILLEYYRQVEQFFLNPLERCQIVSGNVVGGTGILQELSQGCKLTHQDIATLMITVSDNTAANFLIDILGTANINRTIRAFNLQSTILQRKMYDWEAREKGLENFTSPTDMARLLEIFLYSERLSTASKTGILTNLKKQRLGDKLPAETPPAASWAHKTGELPGAEHDVGILRLDDKEFIVAVLTKNLECNKDGVSLISEIGRIIYDAAQ